MELRELRQGAIDVRARPNAEPVEQVNLLAGNGSFSDVTGQLAPPGHKTNVTAFLWEDEGTLTFQVEAKRVCIARREGTGCTRLYPT
jgi:hypothetical protein